MRQSSFPPVRWIAPIAGFLAWLSLSLMTFAGPTKSVMVPMRDGVHLATDIYLPRGKGPWPTILTRTPYNKNGAGVVAIARLLTDRGYAFVCQDFRGRFASEGDDFIVFFNDGWGEHRDGYDTVDWIAKQKWCNGKIGTYGGSALGIVQNMMAPTNPPHLICQYVEVAFSDMYHQACYQGGAWRKALVDGWLASCKFNPKTQPALHSHPDYDDFWRQVSPESLADKINIPCVQVGGWYDIFCQGSINQYLAVTSKGGPKARGNCRLVMEPYGHGFNTVLKFPHYGRPEIVSALHWFDVWLKHDGKGIEEIPNVHYYVMGDPEDPSAPGCEWRTSDVWPVPADVRPLYFHKDGRLDWSPPDEEEQSVSYKYDPKNPVETIGGANLMIDRGPMDQRPVENRTDVILFTSPVLLEPLEVTGRVYVKLWASSSALDTDFTAKLCDVYPDGRSMLIADGILRARHRNTFEKSELMEPGKVYEFTIDLWSTSIVFNKAHRIRVAISSSNAPRFEPNPNTGKPSGTDDKTTVATNTIYFDKNRPSHILLPIPKDEKNRTH